MTSGGFTVQEWDAARPWDVYLSSVEERRDLWESNWLGATLDDESAARLAALPEKRRVLVLTEDWCGDAAHSVPLLAKAFAATPLIDARYLLADDHPAALSRYLTHGGRAIPIAIVEDDRGGALGAWGPRPAPLQAMFRARRREIGVPTEAQMTEFYAPILRWYADDGGRTILAEILMLLERGGAPR